jgi:hypothetical protein
MRSALAAAGLLAVSSLSARADWLSDAWPIDPPHGNPAITFGAGGTVVAVIPETILQAADKAGLDHRAAVAAFLGRYAPGQCSDLFVADKLHMGLKVLLKVQREHLNGGFRVEDTGEEISIDYTPGVSVHCIDPTAEPTS